MLGLGRHERTEWWKDSQPDALPRVRRYEARECRGLESRPAGEWHWRHDRPTLLEGLGKDRDPDPTAVRARPDKYLNSLATKQYLSACKPELQVSRMPEVEWYTRVPPTAMPNHFASSVNAEGVVYIHQ